MPVRREVRRNPITGAKWEAWRVDVTFQHPDGRKQRVRVDSPVHTRRGAEEYERSVRNALLAGTFGKEVVEVPTLASFAGDFMKKYVVPNNKESERRAKRRILDNHLVPSLGQYRLDAIGPSEIDAFKAEQKARGLSSKTINNRVLVLHKALVVAVDWGILARAPDARMLKSRRPSFTFLDFEEAGRLAAALSGQVRVMIVVALNTGLRIGEIIALRWSDLDLKAKRMTVQRTDYYGIEDVPKSGEFREIPLNERVAAALSEHRHLRSKRVFCHPDGSAIKYRQCGAMIEHACRAAGIRAVTWHVLRHTFASHLVQHGVSIKAVQELLGHGDITTTMRYAHLAPGIKDEAVATLGQGQGHGRAMGSVAEVKQ